MLRKLLPTGIKARFRAEFRRLVKAEFPDLVQPSAGISALAATAPPGPVDEETGLAVPPPERWAGYCSTPRDYLDSGKIHVQAMRQIVEGSGFPLTRAGRVLEFGCSAGRMLRWLHDLTPPCEVWGADVTSRDVHWCKQHLSPPFHFVTTTTHPHLPFEDRYFGFVFAGSVFTHLDDLAEAWFQELRRVLRPGGRLYVTLHDRHTLALLERQPELLLARVLRARPEFAALDRARLGRFSVHGADWSQIYVFYDLDYLCSQLRPFFRTLSVTEEAYGYQTALLLERR
jgi:SAM-dependent methyltransferase